MKYQVNIHSKWEVAQERAMNHSIPLNQIHNTESIREAIGELRSKHEGGGGNFGA